MLVRGGLVSRRSWETFNWDHDGGLREQARAECRPADALLRPGNRQSLNGHSQVTQPSVNWGPSNQGLGTSVQHVARPHAHTAHLVTLTSF